MRINLEKVASVYSGKFRKCCCGCAGKHTYASAHREWATAQRGYAVTDDEVSDRSVAIIVGKLNLQNSFYPVDAECDFWAADIGGRTLIAYMKQ